MDGLLNLAKHNLEVIEDAAQAPGAVYKNEIIGSKAHMTVFSLNVTNILYRRGWWLQQTTMNMQIN